MEGDSHYLVMMEITIMGMVVLLIVGYKLDGAVQEDLRTQEIHVLKQSPEY